MNSNRLVRLKSRPRAMATRENFVIDTEPVPSLRDGEIEIDTKFVSLDPAMRGWMSEGKSYAAPVGLGDVMRAYAAGHVVASRHADFREGDAVVGVFGVQSHPVVDGIRLSHALRPRSRPATRHLREGRDVGRVHRDVG